MSKTYDPMKAFAEILSHIRSEARQEAIQETLSRFQEMASSGKLSTTARPRAERVPMGTAKNLITRALEKAAERGKDVGLSPKDIKEMAASDVERDVAMPTLYNELARGRADGRYVRDKNNRWHLKSA